jgi:hypothetical protein
MGWGDVDWIGLAEDRNRWRAVVNSVLNLRVPWNAGKLSSCITSSGLSSSVQLHRVSFTPNPIGVREESPVFISRPQIRSGLCAEELLPLPGDEPRFVHPLARRYTDGAIAAVSWWTSIHNWRLCVFLCLWNVCGTRDNRLWVSSRVELIWDYLTADGQSTSSSWYQASLWGPWPDLYFSSFFFLTDNYFYSFSYGILSDEKMGLQFRVLTLIGQVINDQ